MATSTSVVRSPPHFGLVRKRSSVRRPVGVVATEAILQAEGNQRALLTYSTVTEGNYWLVMVIRDGEVINARVAVTSLAEAYANVFRVRYPDANVRARPATEAEIAYPPNEPYDPRD